MKIDKQFPYTPVDASPVKSFFVMMLTRDIKLEDAILDLLDNCVDGILRSKPRKKGKKPYTGYWAKIEFSKDTFAIHDNCGGIPWSLHEYAFRMGRSAARPDNAPGSVGVYGIGLKRAIFKMGKDCLLSTQNGDHGYEVEIKPDWVEDENSVDAWKIPVRAAKKTMKEDGTSIVIGDLYPGISQRFGEDAADFQRELKTLVETHYAYIIEKGLDVTINGEPTKPNPLRLIFEDSGKKKKRESIQPFIFKTTTDDGVEVFLTVGLRMPLPTESEIENDLSGNRYSSKDAGWTILCNDRAVLYCDKTELTGWGETTTPRYHTQFIAVSGVVEFKSDDPSKLPTTTTKRGIDASSKLYLQIKNKMREGMKMYTAYTNKWKGMDDPTKHLEGDPYLDFEEIKEKSKALEFSTTIRTIPPGQQFKPLLPTPRKLEPQMRRITFAKKIDDIQTVALYLMDDEKADPSAVGAQCFDLFLTEARR